MKRALKWLGIVVGVIVVLIVAASLILPSLVSVDAAKARLVTQVKSMTGRDLRIDGPVKFSVFPSLAIEANQISFSNAPGAQIKDMMTLSRLDVELRLIPLLSGTIAVDRFVLVDPVIDLEVDKQGHGNWEFGAAAPAAPAQAAPSAGGGTSTGGGAAQLSALRLGDVSLQNGKVTYLDQRTGERRVLDKINMRVSLPDLDSPFKADGSVQFQSVVVSLKLNVAKARGFTGKDGSDVDAAVTSDMVNFTFKGKASVASPMSANGAVDLKVPSMRKFAAWIGSPITAPGEGFGPLEIAGTFGLAAADMKFTNATIAIDSIKGKANLDVNTAGARPDIKGDLTLESLNMNPYLPPESKGGGAGSGGTGGGGAAGGSKGWSDAPIETGTFKAANVNFKIAANSVLFRKIKVDRAAILLTILNGKLTLDLTELAAYQGSGKASLTFDVSGAEPQLAVTTNVSGVQVEPLLVDAINLDRLTGKGNIDTALTGHGRSERAIISTLNGKGGFNVANGEIKGLDLLKLLNSATSVVGSVLSGGGGSNTTPFSHLTGTYTMTNGIAHNSDLVLDSPGLKAAGAGQVDLPAQTVDYKVTPEVAGLTVPVIIKGPWDNISYAPDVGGMVKSGVGGVIQGGGGVLKGIVPGTGGSAAPATGSGSGAAPAPSSGGVTNPLKGLFGK